MGSSRGRAAVVALIAVCTACLPPLAAQAGVKKTWVVNKEVGYAETGCETGIVGPGPNYEIVPNCERKPYPVELIGMRINAAKATKVGISAFAKIHYVRGNEEGLLFVSVDGKRVRSERITMRQHGELPTFLLTRLVPVSKGPHEITLSLLAGGRGISGVNLYARGIKTAKEKIPRWSSWVPRSIQE
jgi:hypothetical protein